MTVALCEGSEMFLTDGFCHGSFLRVRFHAIFRTIDCVEINANDDDANIDYNNAEDRDNTVRTQIDRHDVASRQINVLEFRT
jgi:hypothetical protein